MKALELKAEWAPRKDYRLSEFEKTTRKAVTSSSIYKNPELKLTEIKVPKIEDSKSVVLKVKACGICGTDVHLYEKDEEGYVIYPGLTKLPVVLGHEFSGVVEEVGSDVKDLKVGDKVTVEEMNWCGECVNCRNGFPNQCLNLEELGITINGGLAEYISVNSKFCWKIDALEKSYSEDAIYEAGALVEPCSVAYNAIFERGGGFRPGAYFVVYGAGPVGLLAVGLAKSSGAASVIVFEPVKTRMELAKKMGADEVFDPNELSKNNLSMHEVTMELTHGQGADFHLETAGVTNKTTPEMEQSLAVNSKIVQTARTSEKTPMYLEVLQVNAAQVFGAQGHSGNGTFQNVIRMIASGLLDVTKIITSRYKLDHALDAFKEATKREDGKIIINI